MTQSPFTISSTDEAPPPNDRAKLFPQKFRLTGSSLAPHPADLTGALANWACLYGVMTGPSKQPFVIHRHVVNKIPLLRDRFLQSDDSIESQTGAITLGSVDTVAFAVAVDFAYIGRLDEDAVKRQYAKDDENESNAEAEVDLTEADVVDEEKDNEADAHEDTIAPPYDNLLVAVFDLAQALQYEELANAAIDSYCKVVVEDPPSAWGLQYLQRKGLEQSKLMELMLKAVAYRIRSEGYEEWEDHSFMKDFVHVSAKNATMVMKVMAENQDEENPFDRGMDTCEYHTHIATEKCSRRRQIISKMAKDARAKRQKRA